MSNSIMYVCLTTTIMLSDRSMIAPGTPFCGKDVVPATLVSMLKNKTVQAYNPEKPPAPLRKYPIGKTELGLQKKEQEKDSTSNIGLHRRPPETKSDETDARKVLVRAKLKALGVVMPNNARLDTLENRLSREEILTAECAARIGGPGPAQSLRVGNPEDLNNILKETRLRREEEEEKTASVKSTEVKNTGSPGPAQSVWDGNPEELNAIPEDRLLTVYRGTCEMHGIPTQKFDTKELLIAYMSRQFVKK